MSEWLNVDNTALPKNGTVIRTLHSDGKEDICFISGNEICTWDRKTDAPITHFKVPPNEQNDDAVRRNEDAPKR